MNLARVLRGFAVLAAAMLALAARTGVAHAQNAVIAGRVTSDQGTPLEGVNVLITELNVSVGTNAQGRYRIQIPGERVHNQTVALRARLISFQPEAKQIVIRAGEQTVDFQLKTDVQHLSAVVTTGVTGATEQAKLPFNVAQVNAATDLPVPAVNPLSELAGKVPGAQIVQSSGRPGSQPAVLLRGPKSINASGRGQDPLYILDGVILTGGLPDVNPMDIENIEVVPGAAAASLYGARAGNGVISITTRSGKTAPEGVKFALRSEYGMSDIERRIAIAQRMGLMTDETGQYFCANVTGQPLCGRVIDYNKTAAVVNNAPGDFPTQFQTTNGAVPGFPVDPGSTISGPAIREYFQINRWPGQTYNAVDQFVNPQPYLQNDLDMTGKIGGTNLFASVGQVGQKGAIRYLNGYKRNSLRLNADQRFGDAWTLAVRTYYARSSSDGQNEEEGGGAFFRLTRVPPIVNLLQTDTLGRLYIRPNLQGGGQQNENPLYQLANIARQDVTDRFIGGATLRYAPLEWMDLEGNFSYDLQNVDRYQFYDKGYRTTAANLTFQNNGNLFRGDINSDSYNASLNLTLRKDVGRDLRTRWSFRYLYDQQDVKPQSFQGSSLAIVGVPAGSNIGSITTVSSTNTSVRDIGMFAGLNVEFKDRYIADGLVRRDGSSLFGSDNRWSNFGRVSLAWRVAQEPWFHIKAINELKLRGSYGTAGGRPNFTAQYETAALASGIVSLSNAGNPLLKPEVTEETEGGFDLGLFDRISYNFTYSVSDTKDQILPVPQPSWLGFGTRWQNAGTLQNKTLEMALNVPLIERKNLSWSTRFTYDRNRAVVTQLNVAPFSIGTSLQATDALFRIQQGERYGTFYGRVFMTSCSQLPSQFKSDCGTPTSSYQVNQDGYLVWTGGKPVTAGVTQNLWLSTLPASQAPFKQTVYWGMPMVLRDSTGTAQILPLGNALPDYRFAISQNLQYKRLTLYGLLDAAIGQKVYNQGRHWSYLDFLSADQDQAGKTVETAKPLGYYYRSATPDNSTGVGGFYDILGPNNRFVEDASYAKIREVTAAFHVGPVLRTGDWTVSIIGRNLKTFTKYHGFDPEVGVGTLEAGNVSTTNQSGSSAINAVDAFSFPNVRSVTFSLSTSF